VLPLFHDPNSPWAFRRNEVDLLEEDVDEIYRLYGLEDVPGRKLSTKDLSMEQRLIQEQMETEEFSEAEFSQNVDPMLLMQPMFPESDPALAEFQPESSMLEELLQDTKRPPFYEQVFLWSDAMFQIGKEIYEGKDLFREQAFRIYLNAKLVPIKLSVALQEELQEDPLAEVIAEKEYRLALTYLDRILESLQIMHSFEHKNFEQELKMGSHIKQIIKELLMRLRRRSHRNKQGFV